MTANEQGEEMQRQRSAVNEARAVFLRNDAVRLRQGEEREAYQREAASAGWRSPSPVTRRPTVAERAQEALTDTMHASGYAPCPHCGGTGWAREGEGDG